jgi:propanol-preferring alcohol dehydrogenase
MIGLDMESKEDLIKVCGAETFVDDSRCSPGDDGQTITQEVLTATGGKGASAVVVCTASNDTYTQTLGYLKFNGTVVCGGVPGGNPTVIGYTYPH